MSRRDDTITLRRMLDHAREAVALSRGRQRIDLDILWNTVEFDFPALIARLEAIPGL